MFQVCRSRFRLATGNSRAPSALDLERPSCQSGTVKNRDKALQAIQRHGALLVYPLKGKAEPLSLWTCLHPRSEMRWAWDEDADSRVGDLWILREELSRSEEVVYAKWFQNRATFFSREVFVELLTALDAAGVRGRLRGASARVMEVLEMDSPQSTKQLKEASELQGRWLEAEYNRAMKVLWQRLLVVGFGEIQDSSFPSLAVSATSVQFEDLWSEAAAVDPLAAEGRLHARWAAGHPFRKFLERVKK